MPLPHSDLLRFQNQMIPRYTLSASGPSSNLRKVVAAQQLSLIRSPDCAYLYEKCGLATLLASSSIASATTSGAAWCDMWPTSLSRTSFAYGNVAAKTHALFSDDTIISR